MIQRRPTLVNAYLVCNHRVETAIEIGAETLKGLVKRRDGITCNFVYVADVVSISDDSVIDELMLATRRDGRMAKCAQHLVSRFSFFGAIFGAEPGPNCKVCVVRICSAVQTPFSDFCRLIFQYIGEAHLYVFTKSPELARSVFGEFVSSWIH